MARRSSLRASDADRDAVAERLRQAAQEGRIFAHELEERMATALRARTYGELDAIIADLPGGQPAHVPQRSSTAWRVLQRQPAATVAIVLAVTLVTLVLAALVLAGIAAFSGVWVFFLFFWMWRGGPRRRGRQYRRHTRHGYSRQGYAGYRHAGRRW